jgi:hypothetical protein
MKHKEIVCPFCQTVQSDDYISRQDNYFFLLPAHKYMTCEFCDKEYWIIRSYIPQYETFKTEEEMEDCL